MSDATASHLHGEEPTLAPADAHDVRYWSVTTLIGVLDKPALVPWAAIKTAEAAVDKAPVWQSILESDGRDEAITYLKGARFRRGRGQRSAPELGTAVHRALQHKVLYGRYRDEDKADQELVPYLAQANRFLKEFGPRYVASELTVYSPEFGYAGTLDAILELDGSRFIADYKTSAEPYDSKGKPKSPYPEVALQLAAYRHAQLAAVWRARQSEAMRRRYYLLSDNERALAVPVPEVDHGVAILITPDYYSVHPVRCDEEVFETFLHVIDLARWTFETSKDVIGPPLIPPSALRDSTDPFAGLPKG